jgi:hypothetical protein
MVIQFDLYEFNFFLNGFQNLINPNQYACVALDWHIQHICLEKHFKCIKTLPIIESNNKQ